jgi:hypothetical protein
VSEQQSYGQAKMGSERGFGLVFTVVFLGVAFWPMMSEESPRIWALGVASAFLMLALIAPKTLAPLNKRWFKFGLLLGKLMNPVIMSLLFLLAVLPTGLIMRALGKDLLRQKLNKSAGSYWILRKESVGSMKNQF